MRRSSILCEYALEIPDSGFDAQHPNTYGHFLPEPLALALGYFLEIPHHGSALLITYAYCQECEDKTGKALD